MTDSPDTVVIERDLDAPVDVVWAMWTDPEHFRQWYGPDGAAIPVADLDVRVGGPRLVCMEVVTPEGPVQMWFAGEHREVVERRRLVYTESESDADGTPASPPTVVTVELEDLGGRTRVVLTHAGVAPDSPGAMGWQMALDKLAALVA
jgi:uncharacterized protein YndB with AHSA1/START domain